MLPVRAACALAFSLVTALPLLVPSVAAAAGQDTAITKGSPVVVEARTLIADNRKKLVTYKKDVVVRQGGLTLYADEVQVSLAENKDGNKDGAAPEAVLAGSGNIKTIRALGGVRLVMDDKTATSDEAVYTAETEEIVMTGSPRVWQGPNVLTGSKITFSIPDDTISVEDAKTVLYPDEGPEAPPAP